MIQFRHAACFANHGIPVSAYHGLVPSDLLPHRAAQRSQKVVVFFWQCYVWAFFFFGLGKKKFMLREINCYKCQAYLGEIRDAKLRKDILFVCGKCVRPKLNKENDETVDMLKGLFGMK